MGLYWHGITHDLPKLLPSEFFAYAKKFYGGDYAYEFFRVEYDFKNAWFLHQKRNKHHWNYWVDDKGTAVVMPAIYVKQMLCDWRAMGRQFGDTAKEFYTKNKVGMNLHPATVEILERLI